MSPRYNRNRVVGFNFDPPDSRYGNRVFLFVLVALCAVGILMVFSSSFVKAFETYRDPYYFLRQHLVRLSIGAFALMIAYRMNYHWWRKWSVLPLGLSVLALIWVLFSSAGIHRWLTVAGMRFQPSEFARVFLLIYLADWCARHADRLRASFKGFSFPLGIIALTVALVVVEPSYSAAAMILVSGLILLIIAGARWYHLAMTALPLVPAGVYLAVAQPYRLKRILSFLNPLADPLGSGYQSLQSMIAVGSGRLLGLGFGMSGQKSDFLPEAHCDFIFSILCEERGFVGAVFVVALFVLLVWMGVKIALRAPDRFGFLLAGGLTLSVGLFAAVNIAVALGMLPVTGLPLPFISYGGSALIANLFACGIILNVSRFAGKEPR